MKKEEAKPEAKKEAVEVKEKAPKTPLKKFNFLDDTIIEATSKEEAIKKYDSLKKQSR